ncbi:MAGE-like protein 2 [Schistocerca cancellata]|uniref:MAGE-like protein 2 n=1 Tax=Schistocerca cancellata TaxID=274614 RepID=UPI0021199338|nr:MAGE-like protein 2 [Schistocerca cancellata]
MHCCSPCDCPPPLEMPVSLAALQPLDATTVHCPQRCQCLTGGHHCLVPLVVPVLPSAPLDAVTAPGGASTSCRPPGRHHGSPPLMMVVQPSACHPNATTGHCPRWCQCHLPPAWTPPLPPAVPVPPPSSRTPPLPAAPGDGSAACHPPPP